MQNIRYIGFVVVIWTCHTVGNNSGYKDTIYRCIPWFEIARKCSQCGSSCYVPDVRMTSTYEKLRKLMIQEKIESIWIGLRRTWLGKFLWIDCTGPSLDFNKEQWGNHMNCASLNVRDGDIDAGMCETENKGALCQKKDCFSCSGIEEPTNCRKIGDNCFIKIENKMNWETAKDLCMSYNWSLAVFPSREEKTITEKLSKEFKTWHLTLYWIGLRREEWAFWDGYENTEKIGLKTHWGQGQPDDKGNCSIMRRYGSDFIWEVAECSDPYPAFCLKSGSMRKVTSESMKNNEATFDDESVILAGELHTPASNGTGTSDVYSASCHPYPTVIRCVLPASLLCNIVLAFFAGCKCLRFMYEERKKGTGSRRHS